MQKITLDINPKGEIPFLYFSQYDNGRLFQIELVDGEQAYNVPLEYSVQLNVRKTDSKLVTKAPVDITDNILTFATSEQMTACPGENIASVTLKDADDYVITTLYFLISVQRDVLAGGLDSASEIHNLEQQISAIVPEVIGDDYYNKIETDALLANKANMSDLANLASKEELEHAIEEEDRSLKDWAFTQFATTPYVNNLLFNMLPVGKDSGNPCTFDTEIEAVLQELTADIIASGGNGTPSNPIPIVGHSELNLDVNGNTFTVAFGQTVYGGTYDKSGRLTITMTQLIDLSTLTWSWQSTWEAWYSYELSSQIKGALNNDTVPNIVAEKYQTVYLNKILTKSEDNCVGCSNIESANKLIAICNGSDSITPTGYLTIELATPIVIDVQAISPSAVVGTNNIISDCNGDVNVSYKDSIQHYIDTRG